MVMKNEERYRRFLRYRQIKDIESQTPKNDVEFKEYRRRLLEAEYAWKHDLAN
jgi:hypothetical protein